MKAVSLNFLIFACTVFQNANSRLILEHVGKVFNKAGKVLCETGSMTNRLFNLDQSHDPCRLKQDGGSQSGHHINQGENGFHVPDPSTNREQESWGNGYRPNPNNLADGNVARPFSNNEYRGSSGKPFIGSISRPDQYNQNSGAIREPLSSNVGNENIGRPSTNIQYPESTLGAAVGGDSANNGENTSQNCTAVIDERFLGTDVPINCTQGGRRFLTAVKANCADGQVADIHGVCREVY